MKILRLILGDQLNIQHSWFEEVNHDVMYVMMEIRSETDYAWHHIQKLVAFFASMRQFSELIQNQGHKVYYFTLDDIENQQNFKDNIKNLISQFGFEKFEYILPDEYRLDQYFKTFQSEIGIECQSFDSEHFYSSRYELREFFKGKKTYLMESFYRKMRQKHQILMNGNQPLTDKWNYDEENRKKLPSNHIPPQAFIFKHNVSAIYKMIQNANIQYIGNINEKEFIWPINRKEALELLNYFNENCLIYFGTFQDAMTPNYWSVYHSRISFALNVKLLSPQEVVNSAIKTWENSNGKIAYHQLEGFVRQIVGWREYMRGMYWHLMPDFAEMNYFEHQQKLPDWYWTGNTKMHCLKHSITQSLEFAYAHHIQRLMITGNFALLAGIHPDELDFWYLSIYIDALDWVEITNTRGMSQYADGGLIGSKPYVSSASYIHKMGQYCDSCYYDYKTKIGHKACPFNSLYWYFFNKNSTKLAQNPRLGMVFNIWKKMNDEDKKKILHQAEIYLQQINEL